MIGRSDGGIAGGVLPLTDEMRQHGAGRPGSATSASTTSMRPSPRSKQAGGKALMPAFDIPDIGRIAMVADPQGNAVLRDEADSARRQRRQGSDVFSPTSRASVSAGTSLRPADPDAARRLLRRAVRLDRATTSCRWASMGDYRFFAHHGAPIGAVMPRTPERPVALALLHPRRRRRSRQARRSKAGGGTVIHGPAGSPGRRPHPHRHRPAGRRFALVGKA